MSVTVNTVGCGLSVDSTHIIIPDNERQATGMVPI